MISYGQRQGSSGWEPVVHVRSSAGHHISFPQRERFLVMALALLPLSPLLRRGSSMGCFALVVVAKLPSFFTSNEHYSVSGIKTEILSLPGARVPLIGTRYLVLMSGMVWCTGRCQVPSGRLQVPGILYLYQRNDSSTRH